MTRLTATELKPSELRIGNYAIKNKTGEQYALSANDIANFAHSALMQPMFSPIELTQEWLKRMGFEKKPVYGWKGNGQDYQPETSKTEYQDYVIDAGDEDYFFIRYATWSYRRNEESEWIHQLSVSVHKGSWYEKAEGYIPCKPVRYVHHLQNVFWIATDTELNFDVHRMETDETKENTAERN